MSNEEIEMRNVGAVDIRRDWKRGTVTSSKFHLQAIAMVRLWDSSWSLSKILILWRCFGPHFKTDICRRERARIGRDLGDHVRSLRLLQPQRIEYASFIWKNKVADSHYSTMLNSVKEFLGYIIRYVFINLKKMKRCFSCSSSPVPFVI